MRIRLLVAIAIGMLALTVTGASAQIGNELFSQAQLKENTEGNLVEAIKIYQTIVTTFSTDRNLVASALLQIGLCHQKLGQTEEARNAFERIDLEYKDQKAHAEAIAYLDQLDRDLSIEQFGAIRGHVTGPARLMNLRVFALKEEYVDGRGLKTSVAETNARSGEWNLSPLRPGKYYVAILNAENFPIFFPNTPDLQQAKLVEVRPGSTISNVDIEAVLVRDRRVRGRVTGIGPFSRPEDPVQGSPLRVMAIPKDNLPSALTNGTQVAQVNPDGFFGFCCLPRGSYVLWAYQNSYAYGGHVDIKVGDRDIGDVHIAMIPGLKVSGRIVLDQQTGAVPYNFGALGFRVIVRPDPPLGTAREGTYFAWVSNDGSFSFNASGQKGNYRVSVSPILAPPALPDGVPSTIPQILVRPPQSLEDAYVKSIRMGQADVLNDGLHLDGQPQEPLVIVVGLKPGTLEGRVVNTRKDPVRNATVVLIPEGGIRFRVDHKVTATDPAGRFRFERIPPGDYKVFAWRDVENGSWQDPDFVRPYETRGKRIRIEEGGRRPNLEVVSIPTER